MCWVFLRVTGENKWVRSVVSTWIGTHSTYSKLEPYQAIFIFAGLIIYFDFGFCEFFFVCTDNFLLGLGLKLFGYMREVWNFCSTFVLCVAWMYCLWQACMFNSFKFKFTAISHKYYYQSSTGMDLVICVIHIA